MGGFAAGIILNEVHLRDVEARLAAFLIDAFFAESTRTTAGDVPAVFFRADSLWRGLQITPECSVAFFIAGAVVLGALLSAVPRFSVARVLLATCCAASFMVGLNQFRFVALAWVLAGYGKQPFEWAHSLGGSLLMVVGQLACFAIFVLLLVRRERFGGSRSSA